MGKKIFRPEKYGMVVCPRCNGQGYIQAPKRQCCPKCEGFGYIKKVQKTDISTEFPEQYAEAKEI